VVMADRCPAAWLVMLEPSVVPRPDRAGEVEAAIK
jgi:hypothetical protein